jgi:DnaJ like chaperone protein
VLNLLSWLIAVALLLHELCKDLPRTLGLQQASKAGRIPSGLHESAGATAPANTICAQPPCYCTALAPADQALMPMLALFCAADGALSQDETDFVETLLREGMDFNDTQFRAALRLFRLAGESSVSFGDFLALYSQRVGPDTPTARATLDAVLSLALRDGELHPAEERLLDAMAQALNLRYSSYHEFRHRRQAAQDRETEIDGVASCLQVLGLKGGATLRDATNAYKRLASQYHPDRVQHLGPKLRDLAELEMKKLNAARDFLRRHLG